MKFFILLFPLFGFAQNDIACNSSCNESPVINKVVFTPPNQENSNGIVELSGEDFPDCTQYASVTLAGKTLPIISIDRNVIKAQINGPEYQNGTYRLQLNKTNCQNKIAVMDSTISNATSTTTEFITRKTSPVTIYPYSYAEVEVACSAGEKPISGGFIFATWEIKLVSSYPDGNYWRFKVYNNESLISSLNEFYAVCVH
jgi:hypothetical protein